MWLISPVSKLLCARRGIEKAIFLRLLESFYVVFLNFGLCYFLSALFVGFKGVGESNRSVQHTFSARQEIKMRGISIVRNVRRESISIMENAWNDFKKWYDKRNESYIKSAIDNGMSAENAIKDRWGCWSERDLVLHLSRFIYQRTNDLDVHLEFEMKPENFSDKISKLLERAMNKLEARVGKKKVKPDMIICWHDEEPFLAAVEAKMFRGQEGIARRYGRTLEENIKKDIETLNVLRGEGICHEVFWIVLDDYYWLNDKETSKWLEKKMKEFSNKGIRTLFHKSTVKKKFLNARAQE